MTQVKRRLMFLKKKGLEKSLSQGIFPTGKV
jgi:hypothetical protein